MASRYGSDLIVDVMNFLQSVCLKIIWLCSIVFLSKVFEVFGVFWISLVFRAFFLDFSCFSASLERFSVAFRISDFDNDSTVLVAGCLHVHM